jgi:PAS domain S-box-containing protein
MTHVQHTAASTTISRERRILTARDRAMCWTVGAAVLAITALAVIGYSTSLPEHALRAVGVTTLFLAATLLLIRVVRRALAHGDRTRELLLQCLDASDRGTCVIDADDRVVLWNSALEELRDIPPTAIALGRRFSDVLRDAGAVRPFSAFSSDTFRRDMLVARGAGPVMTTVELQSGRILQKTLRPLDDGNAVVIYSDITESKQSELAFRDLATRLAATLDNVLDGIISIDEAGVIVSFSRGAEQMFGYRAEEVLGRNVKLLMPEVHASAHDGYLDIYHRTGVPRIMSKRRELEARHRDGTLFPIELGVSQMPIAGQKHFIGILRDISERKRAERIQQDFISTVSHELRTPLTSIVGSLAVLGSGKTGPLTPRMWQLIELAHRNSERLHNLVNDVLEIGHLDTGRLALSLGRHSAGTIVSETVDSARAYAQLYDVTLNMHIEEQVPDINVDANRLQQIVTNLLSNAVKYSPRGASVDIAVRRHRDSVSVEVADRGPGIPEEFRSRIFGKFAQADASDAKEKGGTGLGLYIARTLADRMGGALDFESRQTGGTVFRIRLAEWRAQPDSIFDAPVRTAAG